MNLITRTHDGILILTPDTDRIDAAGAIYLKDQFRSATTGVEGRVVIGTDPGGGQSVQTDADGSGIHHPSSAVGCDQR